MPLPWIKMWLEALDDPKLTRLSLAERGAWWGILKLAGKCDAGGKIVSGGEGLSIDEIAEALHIKTAEDRQSLESMIAKLEKRGSLTWNENVLTVVHYEGRQRIPPSARPEAVAERVRLHRERRKKTGKGSEVQQLPEAGADKEVPPVTSQATARDSKEATGTLNKAGDEEVLAVWSGVKGFPRDSKEATRFLNKLRAEFPDVDILGESKKWAAAKLSMPLTKRSMPFKQLWAWMLKAREFAQERRGKAGVQPKPKQERRRPITYIRGSEEPGPEDSEDMPRVR
ncbi:unnamed protein product [marine sediment metagenome]|uniref:Phage replisome organiser N-terminal domain-containing protein n=1 Tax=marine sediment metagenome TaxID=412755 RepID=X1RW85_9ZZZZ